MGCKGSKGATAPGSSPEPEGAVQHAVVEVLHNLGHVGEHVAESARQAGEDVVEAARHVGEDAVEAAKQFGENPLEATRHAGENVVEAAKHAGEGVLGAIQKEARGEGAMIHILDKSWYQELFANCTACCAATSHLGDSNLLGSLVKQAVEGFDFSMLGVETEVGTLVLDPTIGRLEIDGLTVFNSEGYKSPYLLRANKVVVQIDMGKLLQSFGKELSVMELTFDGIDVILEKNLHSSNLNDLLKHLEAKAAETKKSVAVAKEEMPEEGLREIKEEREEGEEPIKKTKVVLHTIVAKNIGAKLATTLTGGRGVRLEVATVRFHDWDKEMGPGRGMMEIIHILISTLIKSVSANLIGKHGTEAIVHTVHTVERATAGAVHTVAEKLHHAGSGVAEKLHHAGSGALHGLQAAAHHTEAALHHTK